MSQTSHEPRCFACRRVPGGTGFVSLTVRLAAGARLYFDAQRYRYGATSPGTTAERQFVFFGTFVRLWLFRGLHRVWSFRKRCRFLPPAKSLCTCSDCRRADYFIWPSSCWRANEVDLAVRNRAGSDSSYARNRCVDPSRSAFFRTRHDAFLLALDYRIFRTGTGALAESRRASAQFRETAGHVERIPAGIRVCIRVDAVHRTNPDDRAGAGCAERHHRSWRAAACDLFRWTGDSLPARGVGYRAVLEILSALPQTF